MAMQVGRHIGSVATGLLQMLAAVVGAGIYFLIVKIPMESDGSRSGEQVLLIGLAPVAAGALILLLARGAKRAWQGLTRYTLTPAGLQIRPPVGGRSVAWSQVNDFVLPPAPFPRPPQKLILKLSNAKQEELPLKRFCEAGAASELMAHVPGLAGNGLERVRQEAPKALSILGTRWKRYRSDLPFIFFATI